MIAKEQIKNIALKHGFLSCGIAKAQYLQDDAYRLGRWLENGYQGEMAYMEKNFDLRVDPSKLVPGAQSVITLLYNYFPKESQIKDSPKVSKYAYGNDYHEIIRDKLRGLLEEFKTLFGRIEGRGFVDSAPVLERSWAVRSNLGWVGKNGNLISRKYGSFFFIATLITDLKIDTDDVFPTNHCGTCTKCIDACPTEAILPSAIIDASKCISYATIEFRGEELPSEFAGKMDNWIFGCDICQDVCPWNRFSIPHEHKELAPNHAMLNMNKQDWFDLNELAFKALFKNSAIKRTKYKGLIRNVKFIKSRSS